ncbi:hypothetical protein KC333_g956 [Hortaea werneckii]|nr:hypothetical protein KC333_g956 [Hortaea werneckii]KAI7323494.1 hypothetical protein KC326_g1544 [Hortaea werneckii]
MDCYKTGSRSLASPRRLHATPYSPPVQFSEPQKPSLPPLKTYYESTSKPYSRPECIATKTVRTSLYNIYLQAPVSLSEQETEDRTATRMLSINTPWYDEPVPHGFLQSSSWSQYFMQAHYEYSHGKTRKRSNLPKQSTEIMKTWFDENMSNPYPSEEQKALFSKATGISMTQVSNWFINHRRRCPELRDKRERGRVGGRDFDL